MQLPRATNSIVNVTTHGWPCELLHFVVTLISVSAWCVMTENMTMENIALGPADLGSGSGSGGGEGGGGRRLVSSDSSALLYCLFHQPIPTAEPGEDLIPGQIMDHADDEYYDDDYYEWIFAPPSWDWDNEFCNGDHERLKLFQCVHYFVVASFGLDLLFRFVGNLFCHRGPPEHSYRPDASAFSDNFDVIAFCTLAFAPIVEAWDAEGSFKGNYSLLYFDGCFRFLRFQRWICAVDVRRPKRCIKSAWFGLTVKLVIYIMGTAGQSVYIYYHPPDLVLLTRSHHTEKQRQHAQR